MFAPKLSKVLGVTLSVLTLLSLFASTTFGDPIYTFSNEPQSDGTHPVVNNDGQEITLNYDLNSTITLTLEKRLELNQTITLEKVLQPIGNNPYALAPTDTSDTKWEQCFNPDSNSPIQFTIVKNNSTIVSLWKPGLYNVNYYDYNVNNYNTELSSKLPLFHGYTYSNTTYPEMFIISNLTFKIVGDNLEKTFTNLSQLTEEDLSNARYLYMTWKIKLNGTEDLDPNTIDPTNRNIYQFKIVESKVPSFYSSSNPGT